MVVRVDFDKAQLSDYSGQPDFSIASETTDGISEQKETIWSYPDWNKNWGHFNNVGDLKTAFLMKSIWAVGKGWTADTRTTAILDSITGCGKDTFDDILFNADLIKNVGGDSFAHIIRNKDTGTLINLKPLDPGSMTSVWGDDGLIIRYEQRSKFSSKGILNKIRNAIGVKSKKTFKPGEIFHLMNNRLADQIHGISDIDALEQTILAEQESFKDMQKMIKFQVRPFVIWKLKTDDTTKIAAFVKKVEDGKKNTEDLFVPDDDDLLSFEIVQVNPSSIIMDWRTDLKNKFFRQLGVPQSNFGTSGATESGGKIESFAHEQVWEHNQRYLEKQVWNQLALRIDLISPASLSEGLQTDEAKDANQGLEFQPSDVTAGVGK